MRNRLFVLAAIVGVFLLALGATLAWGGQASAEDPTPTPTDTPTPTPLPAECDIGVVAPGIVASMAGTPIAALTMMVSDPPAIVDLSATFKNYGAYTQGAPSELCSFVRVYAASMGTGDILTDIPVDPTKLGVRVEPVGNASPPYGDVCIECSPANKALGWTAGRCVLQGQGLGGYYPYSAPPWDYYAMPCDEAPFNPEELPMSRVNESCENGVDDLGSEEGTCDWGGFSKQCVPPTTPDVTCLDVPLIDLRPGLRQILYPDQTDTSAREVKVECREPGTYPLALLAGVGYTSTSLGSIYFGPNQDPNADNDTTFTVINVTCARDTGSGRVTVSEGGEVTSDDEENGVSPSDPIDTTVSVPVGSASNDATITIAEMSASDPGVPPAPSDLQVLGKVAVIQTTPEATFSLENPATLTITYDESVAPADESTIEVRRFTESEWVPLGEPCTGGVVGTSLVPNPCISARDTDANSITIKTTSLSDWALMDPLAPIGGVAEYPDMAESRLSAGGSSSLPYSALVGVAAGVVAVAVGGWYARRRWVS